MLKRLIVLSLFIAICATATSQVSKGTKMIGGSFTGGFERFSSVQNSFDGSSLSVAPSFGVFLNDKLAIGARLTFFVSSSEFNAKNSDYYSTTESMALSLTPFVRYYIVDRYFIHSTVGYGPSWRKRYVFVNAAGDTDKTNEHFLEVSTAVGRSIFLNQSIALEGSVEYHYSKFGGDAPTNDRNSGIQFRVGLQVFLNAE